VSGEPLGRTVVVKVRSDSVEGRQAEDALLVQRAQQGDTDAYGELVRRYQAVATRTAYVITGTAADAEEAAQDGFTKAYFALERFRTGAPFRPWLLRIVANEAKNRRKAAGRRPTVDLSVAEDRPSGDTALSPEAAALASERRATVVAALRRLREEDRLVIAYRYFLELSEAEMAEALGVARGTVKSRLSRAIARLREIAGDEVRADG
jgi:RNA polymerase sigma-70 factor, ECF subfamily